MSKKSRSDHWYAWTLVAIAALVFTNAGWYYRWKLRQGEHVEAINALIAARPKPEPRVVYEYSRTPRNPAPHGPDPSQASLARDLVVGEEAASAADRRPPLPSLASAVRSSLLDSNRTRAQAGYADARMAKLVDARDLKSVLSSPFHLRHLARRPIETMACEHSRLGFMAGLGGQGSTRSQ